MASSNDGSRAEQAHAEHQRLFHQGRPVRSVDVHPHSSLNKRIAVFITGFVGTMWCAYVFAAISIAGMPLWAPPWLVSAVQWVSQNFIQLVLLSVIMVGQNVLAAAGDARQSQMFEITQSIHRLNVQQLQILEQQSEILEQQSEILHRLDARADTEKGRAPHTA